MNKEEIEELKDFTIDTNDIDELALGLEVCSKKSNMVIQEFASLIIELEQQNKKLKDNWNKLKEWLYEDIDINDCEHIENALRKMQELEKGDSNGIDMGNQGDHFKICRYEENIKFLKDILKEVK